MTVVAVDPGTCKGSLVIYCEQSKTVDCIASDVDNERLLDMVIDCIDSIDDAPNRRTAVVCEDIESMGMPVGAEVFQTVRWTGRLQERVEKAGMEVQFVKRSKVKMHLCGSARAKDGNIRQALIDGIGRVGTKKDPGPLYGMKGHAFSALAVAVTWAETELDKYVAVR